MPLFLSSNAMCHNAVPKCLFVLADICFQHQFNVDFDFCADWKGLASAAAASPLCLHTFWEMHKGVSDIFCATDSLLQWNVSTGTGNSPFELMFKRSWVVEDRRVLVFSAGNSQCKNNLSFEQLIWNSSATYLKSHGKFKANILAEENSKQFFSLLESLFRVEKFSPFQGNFRTNSKIIFPLNSNSNRKQRKSNKRIQNRGNWVEYCSFSDKLIFNCNFVKQNSFTEVATNLSETERYCTLI